MAYSCLGHAYAKINEVRNEKGILCFTACRLAWRFYHLHSVGNLFSQTGFLHLGLIMSISLSGAKCPACGVSDVLDMAAEESVHDEQLVDVVITCVECHAVFNTFIKINEMEQLP